jgi:putative Mg2+ transporter-C (MgtC) family protein
MPLLGRSLLVVFKNRVDYPNPQAELRPLHGLVPLIFRGTENQQHGKKKQRTLVGTTAALFLLISKYGFTDVLVADRIVLDPSRVAAQIVTGVGFIVAGLIFVKGDRVMGLTTAATAWLVTGVGIACGAGLPLLALAVTVACFIVALVFPRILRLLPGEPMPSEQADTSQHD